MFGRAKKKKQSYAIVGLGRFGYALAIELASSGAEIVVVDKDEEKVRELREHTENAYVLKKLDRKSLAETGVKNCDVAVVGISGEEIDASILTTLHLVSFGIPKVIAKAASADHGEILAKLGAEVVYPERDMAIRLAHRLEASRVLDFVQLSEKLNISKLLVPSQLIGKSVIDANLRVKFGVNIIAIENDNVLIETVVPSYIFKGNDILFVSGSKEGLDKLSAWTESSNK
ncbi:MAG: potassium channel family protein [Candidatus Bruticola sp.]